MVKLTYKILKKIIRSSGYTFDIAVNILAFIYYLYLKLVVKTSKVTFDNSFTANTEHKDSYIICFWHGRVLAMMITRSCFGKVFALVSQSRDADIINRIVRFFKVKTIRGSKGKVGEGIAKGGAASLKRMVNILKSKSGSVAIAADGPIGPRMRVSRGVAALALMSNTKVIGVSVSSTPSKLINTWDKHLLLLPFSRIRVKFTELISPVNDLGEKKATNDLRIEVENNLNNITHQLDKQMGVNFVMPLNKDKKGKKPSTQKYRE